MNIKAKIVLPHVYLLSYPTQYELCMSFVRMQEFYESPKFRGKYFTLETYIDYWSKDHGGSFTYPSVWNGFNVPGVVIRQWRDICEKNQDVMRDRERDILYCINELMLEDGLRSVDGPDIDKIYVIGAHSKSKDISGVIDHESAHAFYRLYPEYKRSCDKILKKVSPEEMSDMKKTLVTMGYNKKVLSDEIQAYSSVPSGLIYNSFSEEFRNNFKEFKKILVKENLK